VIGGQATIGWELIQQLDKIDAVFVPVGGGGLIAGIAGFVKTVSPHINPLFLMQRQEVWNLIL